MSHQDTIRAAVRDTRETGRIHDAVTSLFRWKRDLGREKVHELGGRLMRAQARLAARDWHRKVRDAVHAAKAAGRYYREVLDPHRYGTLGNPRSDELQQRLVRAMNRMTGQSVQVIQINLPAS